MNNRLSDVIGVSVQNVNKTIGNEYGIIIRVNNNNTVNLKLESDDDNSDDLPNVPTLTNLDLKKGNNVFVSYIDNNPGNPVVIGKMQQKKLTIFNSFYSFFLFEIIGLAIALINFLR